MNFAVTYGTANNHVFINILAIVFTLYNSMNIEKIVVFFPAEKTLSINPFPYLFFRISFWHKKNIYTIGAESNRKGDFMKKLFCLALLLGGLCLVGCKHCDPCHHARCKKCTCGEQCDCHKGDRCERGCKCKN